MMKFIKNLIKKITQKISKVKSLEFKKKGQNKYLNFKKTMNY